MFAKVDYFNSMARRSEVTEKLAEWWWLPGKAALMKQFQTDSDL